MRLGAILPVIGQDAKQGFIAEQARQLAGEGFDSLWTVQGIGRGMMIMDPLIALAIAAMTTNRIELGTAVLQLPLYHPVDLAHRVFSLMHICGDRLSLGLGAGSTRDDFEALDRSYGERFSTFDELIHQLRQLFATGELDDTRLTPGAAVTGGPPILLGSWGAGVARAANEYDGWITSAMHRDLPALEEAIVQYRKAGGQRAMVSTIIIHGGTDLGELKASLDRYSEIGFDDAIVLIVEGGPDPVIVRRMV